MKESRFGPSEPQEDVDEASEQAKGTETRREEDEDAEEVGELEGTAKFMAAGAKRGIPYSVMPEGLEHLWPGITSLPTSV